MAMTESTKDKIRTLVKVGKLSNVEIGKEVSVNEKSVRNLINKEGLKKSEITELVKRDIANTIIGNEIKSEKSELNPSESEAYNEVYISLSYHLNLFNSATIENQQIINTAQKAIKDKVQDNDDLAIEQLPNLMAIGKMTETNRKQLYGITETYKEKSDGEKENLTKAEISQAVADSLPD